MLVALFRAVRHSSNLWEKKAAPPRALEHSGRVAATWEGDSGTLQGLELIFSACGTSEECGTVQTFGAL